MKQVGKDEVSVIYKITALRPALFVWLEAKEDGVYSKNMFNMLQGEELIRFTPRVMKEECCEMEISSLHQFLLD